MLKRTVLALSVVTSIGLLGASGAAAQEVVVPEITVTDSGATCDDIIIDLAAGDGTTSTGPRTARLFNQTVEWELDPNSSTTITFDIVSPVELGQTYDITLWDAPDALTVRVTTPTAPECEATTTTTTATATTTTTTPASTTTTTATTTTTPAPGTTAPAPTTTVSPTAPGGALPPTGADDSSSIAAVAILAMLGGAALLLLARRRIS